MARHSRNREEAVDFKQVEPAKKAQTEVIKLISGGRHKHTNPHDINQVFYPDASRPTTVAKLDNWHEVQLAAGVLKRVP